MIDKPSKRVAQVASAVLIYVLIQIVSRPDVLLSGRLLAEEGSFWWAHSLQSNFFSTLLFVPPLTGYFLFNANITMGVWQWLPTAYLPLATTWTSLLVQIQAPLVFLVLTKGKNWRFRFLGFCLILFSPIFTDPESFANSINGQTYLAIIPMIYLALWQVPQNRFSKIYVFAFLLIAFFSGWYSAILFPLFVVRYWSGFKSRFHLVVTILSLVAFFLQVGVFLYQRQAGLLWPNKGSVKFDLGEILYDQISIFSFMFTGSQGLSSFSVFPFILLFLILLLVIRLIFVNHDWFMKSAKINGKWLFLVFIFEYSLVYVGDASPTLGLSGRYLIVPSSALLLFFIFVFLEKILLELGQLKLFMVGSLLLLITLFQYLVTSSNGLLNCVNPCISWGENVARVHDSEAFAYYFWPHNEGNPDWAVSSNSPEVRLAPFQAQIMGLDPIVLPSVSSVRQ